jgi:hypothetical protein
MKLISGKICCFSAAESVRFCLRHWQRSRKTAKARAIGRPNMRDTLELRLDAAAMGLITGLIILFYA